MSVERKRKGVLGLVKKGLGGMKAELGAGRTGVQVRAAGWRASGRVCQRVKWN